MGKINLLGGYYVEPDANAYVLHKPDENKFDKNGKPIKPDAIGYYSSLASAIYGFRKIYGRILFEKYDGEMSLDKAIETLNDLDDDITALIERNNITDY